MAAQGKPWKFEQLAGARLVLELTGWSAPMGRPRQEPVVRDGVSVRKAETYYPGNEDGPTRHIFGRKYTPWELRGRFRDRAGGKGFAKLKTEEVKRFVSASQQVRISWGDIVSAQGFIDEFDPGRESEGEVEWVMRISIDVDLFDKKQRKPPKPLVSTEFVQKLIAQELQSLYGALPPMPSTDIFTALDEILNLPANVAGQVLEKLDSIVSIVTGTVGQFQEAASNLNNVEKATFAQLNRLVNVSVQVRGTLAALDAVYTNTTVDAALTRDRALENAKFWTGQSSAAAAIREMQSLLAGVERSAQLAIRGRGATSRVVRGGDTWEQIATKHYGAPDRANSLIDANGVQPGAQPIAGHTVILPP